MCDLHRWVVCLFLWFKKRKKNSATESYFLFCPFSPPLFYIHLLVLIESSQAFQPNANIKWRLSCNFKAKQSNSPKGREGSCWLFTDTVRLSMHLWKEKERSKLRIEGQENSVAWYKLLGSKGKKLKYIDFSFHRYQSLSCVASSLTQDRTHDCLCLKISRLWRRSMSLLFTLAWKSLIFSHIVGFWPSQIPNLSKTSFSYQTKNYMHNCIECTIFLNKYNIIISFTFGPEILT